jgi:hypothetical protein
MVVEEGAHDALGQNLAPAIVVGISFVAVRRRTPDRSLIASLRD